MSTAYKSYLCGFIKRHHGNDFTTEHDLEDLIAHAVGVGNGEIPLTALVLKETVERLKGGSEAAPAGALANTAATEAPPTDDLARKRAEKAYRNGQAFAFEMHTAECAGHDLGVSNAEDGGPICILHMTDELNGIAMTPPELRKHAHELLELADSAECEVCNPQNPTDDDPPCPKHFKAPQPAPLNVVDPPPPAAS